MEFKDFDIKEFSNPLEDNFDIKEDFYGSSNNEEPFEEDIVEDSYVNSYYNNSSHENNLPFEEDSVYDLYKEDNKPSQNDKSYSTIIQLVDLIGFLEDEEVDNIEELYGITKDEYMNPTKETLEKVKNHLLKKKSHHL